MQRTLRRSCQHCPKKRWNNSTDRSENLGYSQRKNLRNDRRSPRACNSAGSYSPSNEKGGFVNTMSVSDAAKSVVRRNTEEVQGQGKFEVFEQLFADDFVDYTPQPGTTPDKAGVRKLYTYLRLALPDFHAEIHWQLADGDRVTTFKTS